MTQVAFITGGTNALGASVAKKLCKAGYELELLVSAEQQADVTKLCGELGDRVRVHLGNSDAIDFGLGGAEYRELAGRITVMACLELPPPPGAKGSAASAATREIVELGLVSSQLQHVLVLSHVDVCGDLDGTFGEHDLEAGGNGLGPGQEDRLGAERILRRFFRQLPLTVLRSGWIVGSAPGLCPLAHLLLALDSPEELGVNAAGLELYATPLPDLARIAAGLMIAPSPLTGRTLHVVGEELPPLAELHEEMVHLASSVVPAGFNRGAGARRAIKRDPLKKEWFVQEFFRHQPRRARITTAYTRGILAQLELTPPIFTTSWLEELACAAGEEIVGYK